MATKPKKTEEEKAQFQKDLELVRMLKKQAKNLSSVANNCETYFDACLDRLCEVLDEKHNVKVFSHIACQ